MNINCIICSDIFTPQSEIYVTKCGHIFHYHCLSHWLERSKTCPQCRHSTTEKNIHRVYVNVANIDNVEDAGTLQLKVDDLRYQITCKDKDNKLISEKYQKAKSQNAGLREEIKALEHRERSSESAIQALQSQVAYHKVKSKETDRFRSEAEKLRQRVKNFEYIDIAIHGSKEQANEMLRNQTDAESLALLAVTLKRTLVDTEKRKREIEIKCKQMQNEATQYRRDINVLESRVLSLSKELGSLKHVLDTERENRHAENKYVREKISNKLLSQEGIDITPNSSLIRVVTESPMPACPKRTLDEAFTDGSRIVINNIERSKSPVKSSNSPYLAIKSNSVCIDLTEDKSTSKTRGATIRSIFKTTQLGTELNSNSKESTQVSYNGLGGSSKDDIFPSPRPAATGIKRLKSSTISSSKFQKLAPMTKKSKLKDYFSQP